MWYPLLGGCYEGYRDERLALVLRVRTFAGRQRHMYRLITGQTEKLEMHTKKCCWVRKENLEVPLGRERIWMRHSYIQLWHNYRMLNWFHALYHEHSERANFSCLIIYRRIKFNRQKREGRVFQGVETELRPWAAWHAQEMGRGQVRLWPQMCVLEWGRVGAVVKVRMEDRPEQSCRGLCVPSKGTVNLKV